MIWLFNLFFLLYFYFVAYLVLFSEKANAETYHYKNGMVIQAQDYKSAAKFCFKTLTKGVYPGEEAGLVAIDLCANPTKGDIKWK